MMITSLILPVLAQVGLTLFLLAWVPIVRTRAINEDRSLATRAATDSSQWPERSRQISNCYSNQFELPMLFYLVILFYMITGGTGIAMTILAWIFVFFRIVHMIIHTGTNHLKHRFLAFAAGMVSVVLMWVVFAIHYFT